MASFFPHAVILVVLLALLALLAGCEPEDPMRTATADQQIRPVTLIIGPQSESETLYEGLRMRLARASDSMTDEVQCVLFLDSADLAIGIYNESNIRVWAPSRDNTRFESGVSHWVRIPDEEPLRLSSALRGASLVLDDPSYAHFLIPHLLSGESVRFRVHFFGSRGASDIEFRAPHAAWGYSQGIEECDWRDLGVAYNAPDQISLTVYESDRPGGEGYADVRVETNPDLGIMKGFDRYGGGCHIRADLSSLFGRQRNQWTIKAVDPVGISEIKIFDQRGVTVFSERVAETYSRRADREMPWPHGHSAAHAAWTHAPEGFIQLTGTRGSKRVSLLGFRELWHWGIENCNFPTLE